MVQERGLLMREKLIRDRIPGLFNIPSTEIRIATEEQLERFLAAKLEVVWAIAQARGLDVTELERVRADKANERAGARPHRRSVYVSAAGT